MERAQYVYPGHLVVCGPGPQNGARVSATHRWRLLADAVNLWSVARCPYRSGTESDPSQGRGSLT